MSDERQADSADPIAERDASSAAATVEPQDFYLENGLVVFTASYHLKRGYCCNSGCRHCPFH